MQSPPFGTIIHLVVTFVNAIAPAFVLLLDTEAVYKIPFASYNVQTMVFTAKNAIAPIRLEVWGT